MNEVFKGYINYGCLTAEKRVIFTAGNPSSTATVSEVVEYTVPDGWKLNESAEGEPIVTAPWGWDYNPNDLLAGNDAPCFCGIDKGGNGFRISLEYKKL